MSEIYGKMCEVMKEVESIGKDKTNTQQGFNFRGIDQVYNELHSIMAKVGIFCMPEVLEIIRETTQTSKGTDMYRTIAKVKYSFASADGSSVSMTVYGEGMDSGDKATSKSLAIAHKYALLQAFLIPTEDMVDPDQTTQPGTKKWHPEPEQTVKIMATLKQRDAVITEAKKKGHDVKSVQEYVKEKYKVLTFTKLTQGQGMEVMSHYESLPEAK